MQHVGTPRDLFGRAPKTKGFKGQLVKVWQRVLHNLRVFLKQTLDHLRRSVVWVSFTGNSGSQPKLDVFGACLAEPPRSGLYGHVHSFTICRVSNDQTISSAQCQTTQQIDNPQNRYVYGLLVAAWIVSLQCFARGFNGGSVEITNDVGIPKSRSCFLSELESLNFWFATMKANIR